MSDIFEYITFCREENSIHELALSTSVFLKNCNCDVTLFRHNSFPDSIKILNTNNKQSLEQWCNRLKKIVSGSFGSAITEDGFNYYFSDLKFDSETVYIIATKSGQRNIDEILKTWQILTSIQQKNVDSSKQDVINNYGNLISQLLHDVQFLIDNNESRDDQVLKRIEYQKKLNKELLFYIRDFDLFKTEIDVGNLIQDSLKLLDMEPGSIKLKLENSALKINVDVELFSGTFNEIVKNAIREVEYDLSKILIKTYNVSSESPFLTENWIVFEVLDQGKGISDDFIPFVSRPFFTTHKDEGHPGFGLANAEKIIKAHNGFLDIETGNGTKIKIYLPI